MKHAAQTPGREAQPGLNIMIVDDHPVVRVGLQALIETAEDAAGINVVASIADPDEAVVQVRELQGTEQEIDVVLMDLRFGEGPAGTELAGGVRATQAIRAIPDGPQVLVVTNYSTDQDVVGAVSAGAVGYLLKDAPPSEVLDGIRRAARGESVMAPEIMGKLMGQMTNPTEALTPRELEVLALVGEGKSNRDIARQLVLTEATVKSHLSHVFRKLGANNRTSAVAVARQRGIIA